MLQRKWSTVEAVGLPKMKNICRATQHLLLPAVQPEICRCSKLVCRSSPAQSGWMFGLGSAFQLQSGIHGAVPGLAECS